MHFQNLVTDMKLVPAAYIPLAAMIYLRDKGHISLSMYSDMAASLRIGMLPSVRVNASFKDTGKSRAGQVYFLPDVTAMKKQGMPQPIINVVGKLRNIPELTAGGRMYGGARLSQSPERAATLAAIERAFNPHMATSRMVKLPDLAEEAVAITAQPAPAVDAPSPSAAERLVKGVEDTVSSNRELLAELREGNALMRQLVNLWQPAKPPVGPAA